MAKEKKLEEMKRQIDILKRENKQIRKEFEEQHKDLLAIRRKNQALLKEHKKILDLTFGC